MGTAAGLILGIRALSMKTRVVTVRVNSEIFVNVKRLIKLIYLTNSLLSSLDPSFSHSIFANLMWKSDKVSLAPQYALSTETYLEAISLMNRYGKIKFGRNVYRENICCAIDDTKKSSLKNNVVLFWNTYNSPGFFRDHCRYWLS